MKINRLYIENFMCYDKSFVDFTQFNSVIIVGQHLNNDNVANGVGKSTIFRAIEYVLFNHSDYPLERIIRDDTDSCKVILDFCVGDEEYRLSRSRTKKGNSDLSLFQKKDPNASAENGRNGIIDLSIWNDISERRTSDTEKTLNSLIKINCKSFRSSVHFKQNDFSGLTTATPEKRKLLLKEALNLLMYAKMEKIAKDRYSSFSKEAEKFKLLTTNLGQPISDLIDLSLKISTTDSSLKIKELEKDELKKQENTLTESLNAAVLVQNNIEQSSRHLLIQHKTLATQVEKLSNSKSDYLNKKNILTKSAQSLVEQIKSFDREQKEILEKTDFLQQESISQQIIAFKEQIGQNKILSNNLSAKIEEAKVPLPDGNSCQYCRQSLSEEHREQCQLKLNQELEDLLSQVKRLQQQDIELNKQIKQLSNQLLTNQQNQTIYNKLSDNIKQLQQEISSKKNLHQEYSQILINLDKDLLQVQHELSICQNQLQALPSAAEPQSVILSLTQEINILKQTIIEKEQQYQQLNNHLVILQHSQQQKQQDAEKLLQLTEQLNQLNQKSFIYPSVIQALSSSGIPNLIIQNILDDYQTEANKILSQLRPDMQISFVIAKEKTKDGADPDTLDINYFVNGKSRYYEQLSGAMQVSAMFSLKLGLSFLLQKMMDVDIKFLLLDEVDQPLDKASTDAYADIIKFFQKDFKIFIISHDDRLKGKFPNTIVVEQDDHMISRIAS